MYEEIGRNMWENHREIFLSRRIFGTAQDKQYVETNDDYLEREQEYQHMALEEEQWEIV